MTNDKNPLYWLAAETGGVVVAAVLLINYFQTSFFEITSQESILAVLLAGFVFRWGYNGITDSEHTRYELTRHRVILPLGRAGKRAFTQLSKKIPQLDFFVKLFDENQSRQEARQVVEDFVTVAFGELNMDSTFRPSADKMDRLADEIATETTHLKRDGYRRIADTIFADETDDRRNIRLIIILCREYINANDTLETGETIHDLQSGISYALSASACDFEQWNDTAQKLLAAYGVAYSAIHHDEPLSSDPLEGTPDESPKEYYNDFREYFLPFRDRNALSEELVATIIDVIDRGELDQSVVARDIDSYLEKERERIKSEQNSRQAYLLVSMKAGVWGDTRQKIYDKFPNHIRFGNTYNDSDNSELPNTIQLTTEIIFTDKSYSETEEFLEEIRKIVPEEDREGGLLSAYQLEINDPAYVPPKEVAQRQLPANRLDEINVVEFIETGDSSRAITEIAINNLLGKKIRVRDLLAAIPVNVFADAPPNQREIVDAAYEDMKDELGVGELYDWGKLDIDDIAPQLINKDQTDNEERVGTDEEWEEIAEELIESARECERAARS